MKVVTAKTAGFCFGVQRAVDKVYELISQNVAPIYTLGPIIHNEGVVEDLEKKGVQVIQEDQLETIQEGTVVIRSHGVGKNVYDRIRSTGSGLCRCHLSFCTEDPSDRREREAWQDHRS